MMTKKVEIVLFIAAGLFLTGEPIMTPVMMVLMLVTNDVLAMSLTTDRASPSALPSRWHMRRVTGAAVALGACKLVFSTAILWLGQFWFGLGAPELQTFAFVTLLFGSQGLLYVLRERHHLWSSMPSKWVFAASAADIGIVAALSLTGTLIAPLPWPMVLAIFGAVVLFTLLLDQIKRPVLALFGVE